MNAKMDVLWIWQFRIFKLFKKLYLYNIEMIKYLFMIILLILIFYIVNININSIYFKMNYLTDEYIEHFINYI